MGINDWFDIHNKLPTDFHNQLVSANRRYAPKRFHSRRVGDGLRVWRTE